jgi:hypothetical protein
LPDIKQLARSRIASTGPWTGRHEWEHGGYEQDNKETYTVTHISLRKKSQKEGELLRSHYLLLLGFSP